MVGTRARWLSLPKFGSPPEPGFSYFRLWAYAMERRSKSTADAFVEFSRVGKSYDGHTLAVDDFNLRIPQDEFVTLLGPSGCGKTTCLKMLAGFEHPTAGEIFLKNRPIAQIKAHKRNIGVVFQQYALFPHMTVAENLAFPLQARRASQQQVADSVARAHSAEPPAGPLFQRLRGQGAGHDLPGGPSAPAH